VLHGSSKPATHSRPIVADTARNPLDPSLSAIAATGFEPNTQTSPDIKSVAQIDESAGVKSSYSRHRFVSRRAVVYAHKGLTYDPATWPKGVTGSASVVYDRFATAADAAAAATDSGADLKASGMRVVTGNPVAGAQVVQRESEGLLTTIIVVPGGSTVVKIAGACVGCHAGTVPSDLTPLAVAIVDAVKATP
jgi:hypothetical protein